MDKMHKVTVIGLRREKMTIDLTEEQMQKMTVLQLKEKIFEIDPQLGDVVPLFLIFKDKVLDRDSLLCSYGIQHKSVIQLKMMTLYGGGSGSPSPPPRPRPPRRKSRECIMSF
ncbi:uncharacterized protein V6R79_012260 [Siganus canaliculatus]